MNRRELLALLALPALPKVKSIEVAHVSPSDVIVVESDDRIDFETARRIEQHLSYVWPDNKITVLSGGLKIRIARGMVA